MERKNTKTWADLKEFANGLNEEQLSQPLIWWGEDTGGTFSFFQLEEDYIYDGEAMSPKSSFDDDQLKETMEDDPKIMVKGTPMVSTI